MKSILYRVSFSKCTKFVTPPLPQRAKPELFTSLPDLALFQCLSFLLSLFRSLYLLQGAQHKLSSFLNLNKSM